MRNQYKLARALLEQLQRGRFDAPFDRFPEDGPLSNPSWSPISVRGLKTAPNTSHSNHEVKECNSNARLVTQPLGSGLSTKDLATWSDLDVYFLDAKKRLREKVKWIYNSARWVHSLSG